MVSEPTLTVVIWVVVALGWAGFLIIFGALIQDVISAVNARRASPPPDETQSP